MENDEAYLEEEWSNNMRQSKSDKKQKQNEDSLEAENKANKFEK